MFDNDGTSKSVGFDFKSGEVFCSCSTTFNNRMYIFGGAENKRQISEVTGCELKQIGQLGFDDWL